MTNVAGVDLGGTKILCGVVDDDGGVVAKARVGTPKDATADQMCDAIAEAVRSAGEEASFDRVGVGVAAYVDQTRSRAMFAPHLPFRDYPLREELEKRLDLPVVIENDANAAIWAEVRFGSARDAAEVIGLTIGTGIGGAIVLHGDLYRGAGGMAAEFGHLRVEPDGRPCMCGKHGCWEQYASGGALTRAGAARVREHAAEAGMLHDLAEGDPERVTGPMVSEAARAGDAVGLAIFAELGQWLGAGLASVTALLDPQVVVIGGGLAQESELFLPAARESFAANLPGREHRTLPELRPASLLQDAGFLGAADLARH